MSRDNRKSKERRATQLKMPVGTANAKLRLKVIFDLLREFKKNTCSRCGQLIDSPEDLSVVHREQWLDKSPVLFWKTDNIAFSHRVCPDAARHKEKTMSITDVRVISERGEELNTYFHEGKIFVAGDKGDRYSIRIRNNSSDRIEAVCSVDGRDVVSGEVADFGQHGYLINPWSEYTIEGFRQNDSKVAAFRFSSPGKSYSSKMGTPQNVGVIGVAVFREKCCNFNWDGVIPTGYSYSGGGQGTFQSPDVYSMNVGASVVGSSGDSLTIPSFESSYNPASVDTDYFIPVSPRARRRHKLAHKAPEIGTEYGESITSTITKVEFARADEKNPNEVWSLHYDTIRGLKRRGVNVSQVANGIEPDPFPGIHVAPGYAQPPPK